VRAPDSFLFVNVGGDVPDFFQRNAEKAWSGNQKLGVLHCILTNMCAWERILWAPGRCAPQ